MPGKGQVLGATVELTHLSQRSEEWIMHHVSCSGERQCSPVLWGDSLEHCDYATFRMYPRGLKTHALCHVCTWVSTPALWIPKVTQRVFSEWLSKFCYVLRTEFYPAIKKSNCDASHEDEDAESYSERGNASPQGLHSVDRVHLCDINKGWETGSGQDSEWLLVIVRGLRELEVRGSMGGYKS